MTRDPHDPRVRHGRLHGLDRLDRIGLALLGATALTWALGESGTLRQGGWAAAALVLGLAFAKGVCIALDFMELRHAPRLWRRAVLAWLALVLGGIALVRVLAGGA